MSKTIRNVLLILACVVIIVGGIGGYFVYATYFEDEEPDTNITDSSSDERENEVEDVDFIVYDFNGNKLAKVNSFIFNAGEKYTFKVSKSYNIKIVPNAFKNSAGRIDPAVSFNYMVGNQTKYFATEGELTKGFNLIQNEDNSFTLDLSNGANLKNVLEKIYGSPVQVNTADVLKQDKIFTIVITPVGGQATKYIDFGLNTQLVYLSAESIVIG